MVQTRYGLLVEEFDEEPVVEQTMLLRALNVGIIPFKIKASTPLWTPQSLDTNNKRLRRARERGHFHGGYFRWSHTQHYQRKRFKDLLQKCVWEIVNKYTIDNVKCSMANPAMMALFSPSSFDIYFGDNLLLKGNKMVRTAYAQGSGVNSIGLDPRYAKIHHIFPQLSDLRKMVIAAVKQFYADNNEFGIFYCEFNHVSVKLYFNDKKTGWHVDVTQDKATGKAKENNSQMPNTPVAIVSFGDAKVLEFMKRYSRHTKVSPEEVLRFFQTTGTVVILDPRDEEYDEKLAHWMHRSYMLDKENGVSMTLMFRVVQKVITVKPATATVVDGKVGGEGTKKRKMDVARNHLQNRTGPYADYDERHGAIFKKIRTSFNKHSK